VAAGGDTAMLGHGRLTGWENIAPKLGGKDLLILSPPGSRLFDYRL
jgi:hypothetical protein